LLVPRTFLRELLPSRSRGSPAPPRRSPRPGARPALAAPAPARRAARQSRLAARTLTLLNTARRRPPPASARRFAGRRALRCAARPARPPLRCIQRPADVAAPALPPPLGGSGALAWRCRDARRSANNNGRGVVQLRALAFSTPRAPCRPFCGPLGAHRARRAARPPTSLEKRLTRLLLPSRFSLPPSLMRPICRT
jgi:hypothetical protein